MNGSRGEEVLVRFSVELRHTADGVEGEVTQEGAAEARPFSSWLELLQLLEPLQTQSSQKP
jgi:hypothetical protein